MTLDNPTESNQQKAYLLVRFVLKDFWLKVAVDSGRGLQLPVKYYLSQALAGIPLASDPSLFLASVAPISDSSSSYLSGKGSSIPTQNGRFVASGANSSQADSCAADYLEMFGFYLADRGHWLEPDRSLGEYGQISLSATPNAHERVDANVLEIQCKSNFIKTSGLDHYAQGWLYKKGHRSLSWKARFFMLKNHTLFYWKSPADHKPAGFIDLNKSFNCRLYHHKENPGTNVELHVCAMEKTYRMRSDDLIELRHWLRILWSIHATIHGAGLILSPSYTYNLNSRYHHYQDDEDSDTDGSSLGDFQPEFPDNPCHQNNASTGRFDFLRNKISEWRAAKKSSIPPVSTAPATPVPLPYSDIQGEKIGFLYKRGNMNRSYKYRMFVLREKILYYYRPSDQTGSMSLRNTSFEYAGLVNLEGSKIYSIPKTEKKCFYFKIATPSRMFTLYSNNRDEWEDWKDAFEFICGIEIVEKDSDSHLDEENRLIEERLVLDYERYGSPDMEGYLLKQGNDPIGKWRRRWFILLGRTLFYTRTSESGEPLGSVPLSISTITKVVDSADEHLLEITVCNNDISNPILRKFRLKADSSVSLQRWIKQLSIYTASSPSISA